MRSARVLSSFGGSIKLTGVIVLKTRQELYNCFPEKEHERLFVPHECEFPLGVVDTFSWMNPNRDKTYVVFRHHKRLMGMVFQVGAKGSRGGGVAMCDWCHSVRSRNEVGYLTLKSKNKSVVGVHVCRELDCKDQLSSPSVNGLRETLRGDQKINRLLEKMANFATRHVLDRNDLDA